MWRRISRWWARDMEAQYEPVFGRCHNCGQDTLRTWFPNIDGRLVTVFTCDDCDRGHCPRCRTYTPVTARWCLDCGTTLSMRQEQP